MEGKTVEKKSEKLARARKAMEAVNPMFRAQVEAVMGPILDVMERSERQAAMGARIAIAMVEKAGGVAALLDSAMFPAALGAEAMEEVRVALVEMMEEYGNG